MKNIEDKWVVEKNIIGNIIFENSIITYDFADKLLEAKVTNFFTQPIKEMFGGETPDGTFYDGIKEFIPGDEEYFLRRSYNLFQIDLDGELVY